MTKIPEKLIEQAPNWDIITLWDHFRLICDDKRIFNKVKYGVDLKFDIRVILDGNYEEFPRKKIVRVLGYGLNSLYKFKDEIEKREDLMREFIYENFNNDITESRIKEEELEDGEEEVLN